MPQLDPFYFKNEIIFTFIVITFLLYILSKYILPIIARNIIIRMYLT